MLETTSQDVATYWATEAKNLESQCDKRANSQTNIVLQSDDHVYKIKLLLGQRLKKKLTIIQ